MSLCTGQASVNPTTSHPNQRPAVLKEILDSSWSLQSNLENLGTCLSESRQLTGQVRRLNGMIVNHKRQLQMSMAAPICIELRHVLRQTVLHIERTSYLCTHNNDTHKYKRVYQKAWKRSSTAAAANAQPFELRRLSQLQQHKARYTSARQFQVGS